MILCKGRGSLFRGVPLGVEGGRYFFSRGGVGGLSFRLGGGFRGGSLLGEWLVGGVAVRWRGVMALGWGLVLVLCGKGEGGCMAAVAGWSLSGFLDGLGRSFYVYPRHLLKSGRIEQTAGTTPWRVLRSYILLSLD